MSLAVNKTGQLWNSFMPRRKEINNSVTKDLVSLQVYPPLYFEKFTLTTVFEKWALMEVSDFSHVPSGMETFTLPAGMYAVFIHKGASTDDTTFQYIFNHWLPNATFLLDDRPHFELLGDHYKNGDPHSQEEIWIPVKPTKRVKKY